MPNRNSHIKRFLRVLFIIFSIGWVIIHFIYFVLVSQNQIELVYYTPPFSYIFGSLTPHELTDQQSIAIYQMILPFYFFSMVTVGIVSYLIVTKGRTIEEGFAVILAYAIPRRRKLSGRVFDSSTGSAIPFSYVRVIDEKTDKLVASVITDMEGRYRLNIPDRKPSYIVRVQVHGYHIYERPLSNVYKNNVIQDIPLESGEGIKGDVKSVYFYYLKPRIYIYYTYVLFGLSFISAMIDIILVPFVGLSIYLMSFMAVYTSAVVWNAISIFGRVSFGAGKVLEFNTKKELSGVGVGIFDKEKQLQSQYTNEKGIIRTNLPEGLYTVVASKSNYAMVTEQGEEIPNELIFISKDGYLPKNIYLKPLTDQVQKNSNLLQNPFGS